MSGVEVLKNGQTFFKVRDNWCLDDLAIWLGHQTAHTAQLFHLRDRTTRTGVSHHINRVWFIFRAVFGTTSCGNGVHHRIGDFVVTLRPSIDNFVVLFTLSDQAVHVLLFKVFHLLACFTNQWPFGFRNNHVVLTKRNTSLKRFTEAHRHDVVTEDDGLFLTAISVHGVNDLLHFFLAKQTVDQRKRRLCVQRQQRTQTQTARSGFKACHHFIAFTVNLLHAGLDVGVQVNFTRVQSVFYFVDVREGHAFALHALTHDRSVIETQDHIL